MFFALEAQTNIQHFKVIVYTTGFLKKSLLIELLVGMLPKIQLIFFSRNPT